MKFNLGGRKMKKVVLFVVLVMFVAVPAFAERHSSSAKIAGVSIIIPGSTTLAGFASVGTLSSVEASGPMVLVPLGGGTITAGGVSTVTNPTSVQEIDNTASVLSNGAMPAIYTNLGGGVTADSGTISLTASAGANSGGHASASGTVITNTLAATNSGIGAAPICNGFYVPEGRR